jgi:2-phosphoglycerate kinase
MIVVGGTSGSGKSTIASELLSRLGLVKKVQLLSSDELRDEMRPSYPPSHLIWRSTYNVTDTMFSGSVESKEKVLDGFKAQTGLVKDEMLKRLPEPLVDSLVVEGVHMTPDFVKQLCERYPLQVVPLFLRVPDPSEHRHRFETRGPKKVPIHPPLDATVAPMPSATSKYLHYFCNIACISEYIMSQSIKMGYPNIDNTNKDTSISLVVYEIMIVLKRQQQVIPDLQAFHNL